MILLAYRLLCLLMAVLAVAVICGRGTRQQKITAAIVLVPLVLRALLVK